MVRTPVYIVLLILIFFFTKWGIEGAYFGGDMVINTVPLENLYGQIQRSGQSPLWAPELAGGYPLLATGQLGFWYPPHMLLRQFLPGVWTLNISLLLHALLAATGTFVFLKYNKLRDMPAAAAAILLPLGSTFVGKYESLNLVLPFMWVPLLLLLIQIFIEQGKKIYLALWIGATSLCILVGHPQMALYVLFLQVIFVCCAVALQWRRWPRALASLFGVFLALGITSFYFLPIIDNLPDTDRASGTLKPKADGMFDYQFTPAAFLGLFIPHPFGRHETYTGPTNENELSSYMGPVAIMLAMFGIFASRKIFTVLWVFSIASITIGLSLAVGGYLPVFPWLVSHGFTYFNAPSRFFFYAYIGLVFFMAMGLDACKKYKRVLFLATLIPLLAVSWSWNDGVPWKLVREPHLATRIKKEPGFIRIFSGRTISANSPDNDFGIKAWNPICSTCLYRQTFVSPFDQMDGVSVKMSGRELKDGNVKLLLYTNSGDKIRETNVSTKNIIDSEWTNFYFPEVEDSLDEEFYFEITSNLEKQDAPRLLIHLNPSEQYDPSGMLYNCAGVSCEKVREADAAFKIHVQLNEVEEHDALAPYSSVGFGVPTMQWAGSLPLFRVKEYNKLVGTWGDPLAPGARTMINRFAASHILGLFPPHREGNDIRGVTLVGSAPVGDQFVRLYRNLEAFSRVHFAQEVQSLPDFTDQVNTLMRMTKDQKTVVADVPKDMTFDISENTVRIVHENRTRVNMQTEQTYDGFLVFRDIYIKGWVAYVDDVPVTIHRADGIFRGVFVPAGEHSIIFQYKLAWVPYAVWISAISLIIYGILVVSCISKRGYY